MGSFSRHMGRASDYTDSETITAEYDWERRERYAEFQPTCRDCEYCAQGGSIFEELGSTLHHNRYYGICFNTSSEPCVVRLDSEACQEYGTTVDKLVRS